MHLYRGIQGVASVASRHACNGCMLAPYTLSDLHKGLRRNPGKCLRMTTLMCTLWRNGDEIVANWKYLSLRSLLVTFWKLLWSIYHLPGFQSLNNIFLFSFLTTKNIHICFIYLTWSPMDLSRKEVLIFCVVVILCVCSDPTIDSYESEYFCEIPNCSYFITVQTIL